MSDLCPSCKGSGAHLFSVRGQLQLWDCLFCHGAGVLVQYGPAVLRRVTGKRKASG